MTQENKICQEQDVQTIKRINEGGKKLWWIKKISHMNYSKKITVEEKKFKDKMGCGTDETWFKSWVEHYISV